MITATNTDESIDSSLFVQIQFLLSGSSIGEIEVEEIQKEISDKDITKSRIVEIIEYLNMNQLDPVSQGQNYSQTDIQLKLDGIMEDERNGSG